MWLVGGRVVWVVVAVMGYGFVAVVGIDGLGMVDEPGPTDAHRKDDQRRKCPK